MKKKTILVAAIAVMLVAALVVGGTLAYFTDTKTADNTFTMGNVAITLDETNANPNAPTGSGRVTENTYNVYPGLIVDKDPTVTNVGANDAWIRAKIVVKANTEQLNQLGLIEAANDATGEKLAKIFKLGDGWSYTGNVIMGEDGTFTFVMKYADKLAPKAATPVFTQVTIPGETVVDSFNFNINVVSPLGTLLLPRLTSNFPATSMGRRAAPPHSEPTGPKGAGFRPAQTPAGPKLPRPLSALYPRLGSGNPGSARARAAALPPSTRRLKEKIPQSFFLRAPSGAISKQPEAGNSPSRRKVVCA